MDLICKIFGFILNLFTKVVGVVAQAVTILGDATVDVLTDLVTSVGEGVASTLGGSGLLGWLLVGGVAYFFLTKKQDPQPQTITVTPAQSSYMPADYDNNGGKND